MSAVHYINMSAAERRASSDAQTLIDLTGVTVVTSCWACEVLRFPRDEHVLRWLKKNKIVILELGY